MKLPKSEDERENGRREVGRTARRIRHHRARDSDHVTEMLKLCLQKICELQADLESEDAVPHDAEAAGYTACALETLRFLSSQGLPHNHPVVKRIREKLLKENDK